MKNIKTIKFLEPPTKEDADALSKVLKNLHLESGEIPCLLINAEGPYDVYYLRDHYNKLEPGEYIHEIKLMVYTAEEYAILDALQKEMENLHYSCEMNDLMTGGEQFGQNTSSYNRMNEISEQLFETFQIQ